MGKGKGWGYQARGYQTSDPGAPGSAGDAGSDGGTEDARCTSISPSQVVAREGRSRPQPQPGGRPPGMRSLDPWGWMQRRRPAGRPAGKGGKDSGVPGDRHGPHSPGW